MIVFEQRINYGDRTMTNKKITPQIEEEESYLAPAPRIQVDKIPSLEQLTPEMKRLLDELGPDDLDFSVEAMKRFLSQENNQKVNWNTR